ncbi:MAG: hypothetical protein HYV27_19610 [Candidatus Hydrogenedentes bacterium]|nr:hypothetical protein [Candidatus Hydrogenedentota bacterium]
MRKLTLNLGFSLLACGLAAAQDVSGDVDKVEAQVRAAWGQITSLSATLEMESVMVVQNENLVIEGDGKLQYKRIEAGERFHQAMTATLPPPIELKAEFETVFNGEFVFNTRRFQNQVETTKEKPNLQSGALPPGGGWLFATLKETLNLKRLPDETMEDVRVFVLEGAPKEGVDSAFKKVRVRIDKDLGIQRQLELFDADGLALVNLRYLDVKLGVAVEDSLFEVGE